MAGYGLSRAGAAGTRWLRWGLCWLLGWSLLGVGLLLGGAPGSPFRAAEARPDGPRPGSADHLGKRIEDVQPGDLVYAYDFQAGRVVARRVLDVYENYTYTWADVQLGQERVTSTWTHPFWVESEGEWIEAADLQPGMEVLLADGRTATVTGVTLRESDTPEATYNLEVEGEHCYFVGPAGVLVHNGQPVKSFNYVLLNAKGEVYYVGIGSEFYVNTKGAQAGRKRPGLEARLENHARTGAGTAGQRYVPGKDRVAVVIDNGDGTYTYKEVTQFDKLPEGAGVTRDEAGARKVEHELIQKEKTYIGKTNHPSDKKPNRRGNRNGGIAPREADTYYKDGGFKWPYWPLKQPRDPPGKSKNKKPKDYNPDPFEPSKKGGTAPGWKKPCK
jgi:hypothetical protein